MSKELVTLGRVIIRFAGDSGDGMQLTGDQFTSASAIFGNDLLTLPDFPAEIRAPQGTLPGVSAFQLHFADHDITTAGDAPTVLVAMNPAALKAPSIFENLIKFSTNLKNIAPIIQPKTAITIAANKVGIKFATPSQILFKDTVKTSPHVTIINYY